MRDPLAYEDVRLREIGQMDLSMLREWRNDWHVRATTREWRLIDQMMQQAWYENLHGIRFPSHIMFVVELGSLRKPEYARGPIPVGCVGLTYVDWKNLTAEVSIYIAKDWSQKGIGAKAMMALLQYAFLELPLEYVFAEVYAFNEPSLTFFGSLSFKTDGRLSHRIFRDGTFHGSVFFGMTRQEWHERYNTTAKG